MTSNRVFKSKVIYSVLLSFVIWIFAKIEVRLNPCVFVYVLVNDKRKGS